ncbi:Activator of Hsp90 ATPase 1 family protein [Paenibacillus curdlanolyticus YK9]|uniref:Activator of Hsp90 ATPase 1 family protein n=1 Tax=Paenibacillus curdlanolyticus YK9 TaxID=717606 RepID=E0I5I9_9BACL|nr:SRPBCC domain-containing protein [Paenibacillus curdlanolyticus]EFM12231.1 Activator of Hsp90 ATPase 1 family protein [Paenibacillus curdlanolyticus YK9]
MSLTLSLDFQYKTTIEKLWSALTDSTKLAKWTLENDFKPIVGHRFQFRAQPTEYWNGIIDGEVLVVEAPSRLSYTWSSGETHTVTWTIQDLGEGKVNLHLEQTGISNAQALGGAKYGWTNWNGELEKLLAQ